MYRIGFDVGGTFTDFTLHDTATGTLRHFKLASTPADPSEAIAAGLRTLLETLHIAPGQIGFIGHGTTVATNMVIERRGVATGLITTRGFRDVLEIGRQVRPHLYDYTVRTPVPLVPRALRHEVSERIDAAGAVLHPLDESEVAEAADALAAQGVEAIAICFLHSYLNDAHERRATEIVRARLPDVYLSTSSSVLPEFREFERFSTTAINGYIGPRMERYLDRLLGRLAGLGLTVQPYTIHSNGGLMSVDTIREHPVRCCLSGPAAGVVGAAEVAREAGHANLITFDAGGTSTDVSLIEDGLPAFASSRTIADYPVRSPMVDVHVIGAGGGSIAWLDDAGALKVGPRSAGADPGPVAYAKGGAEPTLTDANIVLHRLDPTALLGGAMPVDENTARQAIARRIAAPMGLSVEQAALGIIRIAVANMSRAIRSVSTEKGHDVRAFTLNPAGWSRIAQHYATMLARGGAWLHGEHIAAGRRRFEHVIEARYQGQNHEVQVRLAADRMQLGDFIAAFAEAHRREYGYDVPGRGIEVVNCRLKAVGLIDRPAPHFIGATGAPRAKATRQVHFYEGWIATPVFDRAGLAIGTRLSGPAIIDEMSATTLVPPGCVLRVDRSGNLLLENGA
jgi:N-methylhydantoinase A